MGLLKQLGFYGPLLTALLVGYGSDLEPGQPGVSSMAGVLLLMAGWWITEAVPFAVTALLPLVLLPTLNILSVEAVSSAYMTDAIFVFMGSFLLAQAMENSKLHRRLALRVLLLAGPYPRRLLLGFILISAFLSMFLSNTATSATMVPLAVAMMRELQSGGLEMENNSSRAVNKQENQNQTSEPRTPKSLKKGESRDVEMVQMLENGTRSCSQESDEPHDAEIPSEQLNQRSRSSDDPVDQSSDTEDDQESFKQYQSGLIQSIAYSCSIGGMATLTGTGPNLVLSATWSELYPSAPPLSFSRWSLFALPLSLTFLAVLWSYFCLLLTCNRNAMAGISRRLDMEVVRREIAHLGPVAWSEKAVMMNLMTLIVLLMTRKPAGFSGWNEYFSEPIGDGTTIMAMCLIMFRTPCEAPVCPLPLKILGRQLCRCSQMKKHHWDRLVTPNSHTDEEDSVTESCEDNRLDSHRFHSDSSSRRDVNHCVQDLSSSLQSRCPIDSIQHSIVDPSSDTSPTSLNVRSVVLDERDISSRNVNDEGDMRSSTKYILEASAINAVNWEILILIGGGFALTRGATACGLSEWFGLKMAKTIHGFPIGLLVPSVAGTVAFLTEFTSNTATANVVYPLLAKTAEAMNLAPLMLMLPAALACSFAFMLPVATPPNAIAYSTGLVSLQQMLCRGFFLNLMGIALVAVSIPTIGVWVFDLT